ncbi:ABC transporter ATP-binding protein [Kribbella sp. NBC_00709]|uniref:ABC transporter ATP-binding protein n=1 Tax=Kribbella sp. NBC_00709 TaxID=2975972 RepID=UPI002E2938E3|nr:ABC transporter ATP-binding protein [Kribbella sp. NBC_00709]
MTLYADLQVNRGSFELSLDLTVQPGEVVALLGPNGAGKTTALRAIAGLLALDGGRIALDSTVWDEPPRTFRTPDRRPIGVVFQDYLLFNHLSCLENVAFGLRARGVEKQIARQEAARWLETVGLSEYARTRPRALSGGQAQRVALARALATDPELLLLDEPLAALDASTTLHVRAELGQHLARFEGRTLLVTHDPLDAMVLADRLVIIENGQVVQEGKPTEVAHRPRTDYVAQLVGLNLYRGTATGTTVTLAPATPNTPSADAGSATITLAEPATGPVYVAFPPTAVSLYPTAPAGSPRNTWPAVVTGIEQHAHTVRVRLNASPTGPADLLADITPAAVADLHLTPGQPLEATLKATEVHTYPV